MSFFKKIKKPSNPILIGHLFFILYTILSVYFYKERTMLFDSGVFSFQIVQSESFFFPLNRYGCAITQAIPLLLLKTTTCSLSTFLLSFSISLAIFYYIIFLIIAHLLKNNKLIYIYILALCLTYRNTFYFGVSEFSQALAISLLLYGLVYQMIIENKRKLLYFGASVIVIISMYYFHPLSIISIVFVLVTTTLLNKEYKNKQLYILLLLSLLWFGYNILLKSSTGGYEASRMDGFKEFFIEKPNILEVPSLRYFFSFLWGSPIITFLIILIGVLMAFYKQSMLLGLFFLFFPLVYFSFVIIVYYQGEGANMYEQYYIYFGFFAAIILVESILSIHTINKEVFVVSLLCFSLVSLFNAHNAPTNKINYISNLVKKGRDYPYKKYIITVPDYLYSIGWSTWSLPVESLLISSLNNSSESIVFYVPNTMEEVQPKRVKGLFYCDNAIRSGFMIKDLNKRFFNLPESTNYITVYQPHNKQYFIQKIIESKEWLSIQKEKAKERQISIDEMIYIDAEWLAEEESKKEFLRISIEQNIKSDSVWIKSVEEKAKLNNIPLSEMVRIDAEYILNQESK